MKKILLMVIFGLLILSVIGFVAGQEQPVEEKYFKYWKEIFTERNNMCEEYYGNHIVIKEYNIVKKPEGEYLEVSYQVVISWASIEMKESLLIKPSLSAIYLDKEYMERRSSRDWKAIGKIIKFEFKSYYEVLSEIYELTDSDNISVSKLSFGIGEPYPQGDGNVYIMFRATIDYKNKKCKEGRINLVNGKHEIWDSNCDVRVGGYVYGELDCPDIIAPPADFCKYGSVEEKYENECLTGWECFKELSNGRKAEIKILPSTASQTAAERLGELNFTVGFKELGRGDNIQPVYEVKAKKPGKFLTLKPILP